MKNNFFDEITDTFWYLVFDGQRFLGPCFILILLLKYFFPVLFLSFLGTIFSILLLLDILYLWHYDYQEYQKISDKSKLKNPWWLNPWHIIYPFFCFIPCILYLWGLSIRGLYFSLASFILHNIITVYYDEENNDLVDSDREVHFY